MTDQFLQFIFSIFKTYGIHAGFLVGLLYLFFFKYVPEQASALKELVDSHDKRIRDIVEQFSKTLESDRNNTKELFNLFSTNQEKIMATQEKFMNMILEKMNNALDTKKEEN